MIILGIDPGTATTGFAIVEKDKTGKLTPIKFGSISTSKDETDANRLFELACDLRSIISQYKPTLAGVEKLYFESNQKTAMTVSQARGVVLLSLTEAKIPLLEFTPLQVKSQVCGYGKANKIQVQRAVKMLYKLTVIPKPDDAADALAVAYCAAFTSKLKTMTNM